MIIPTLPAGCLCKRTQLPIDPWHPRNVQLPDGTPVYTPRADCPIHGDPASQMLDAESVINGKGR